MIEENDNHEQTSEESFASAKNLMDTKTSHLDDSLKKKLDNAFHQPTSQILLHNIVKIASEHDPIDLAFAVSRLPTKARIVVYENLPDLNAKIIFIINTGSNTRSIIFRQIDDNEIVELIENMPADEAVMLLDNMSDRRMKRVINRIDPKKAHRIIELQKHDRNSAGRLMSNEFFAFHMNTTIGEVASHIRDNPAIDLKRSIFVLSPSGELAGYVPARNLIVNPSFVPLRQVMRPVLHSVHADTFREEVVDLVERYEIATMPVVDEKDHLIGVIAYDEVIETLEDIADETIASMAGTAEDVSENEPILRKVMLRAPWLFVTLCAGLVTSFAMSHFSGREWFLFVPFFVPLIAGMSGNVGIQCSTVLVRGMATGELSLGTRNQAILKELMIGLTIGTGFGFISGLVIYALNQYGFHEIGIDPFILGVTVSTGVFVACLTATVLGAFSPFLFVYLGIDPAVASGPIVTAFNDVSSTLMFFLVARIVYTFFIWW